ncbi:hypothetical protein H6P81_008744 [Aristolochia fimbriata]|uniref:Thioredoxin domain-containing protein n=1 Tax=Aristolochia fimbriata TaxID=158543 RepID=A0AAV7EKA5_ARIFI|nr:hypothetical protein H6P81_008744 [Aristolochia fimbriata]
MAMAIPIAAMAIPMSTANPSPPLFEPSSAPSFEPSSAPSFEPSSTPSFQPSSAPSFQPSSAPSFEFSPPVVRTLAEGECGIDAINESEFQEKVLQADTPVLVEFVANWCGPCRLISPVVEWASQGAVRAIGSRFRKRMEVRFPTRKSFTSNSYATMGRGAGTMRRAGTRARRWAERGRGGGGSNKRAKVCCTHRNSHCSERNSHVHGRSHSRTRIIGERVISKAIRVAGRVSGVQSVSIDGKEKDHLEIIGDGVDVGKLTRTIQRKMGFAQVITVSVMEAQNGEKKEEEKKEEKTSSIKRIILLGLHELARKFTH